jgi:hypothetical protein
MQLSDHGLKALVRNEAPRHILGLSFEQQSKSRNYKVKLTKNDVVSLLPK